MPLQDVTALGSCSAAVDSGLALRLKSVCETLFFRGDSTQSFAVGRVQQGGQSFLHGFVLFMVTSFSHQSGTFTALRDVPSLHGALWRQYAVNLRDALNRAPKEKKMFQYKPFCLTKSTLQITLMTTTLLRCGGHLCWNLYGKKTKKKYEATI